MRKRYFLITFAIITIIAGVWVWACKHPFGPGISGMSDVISGGGGVPAKGWYMNLPLPIEEKEEWEIYLIK